MNKVLEFDSDNEKIQTKTTASSVRKKSIFDGCSAYMTCENAQKLQRNLLEKAGILKNIEEKKKEFETIKSKYNNSVNYNIIFVLTNMDKNELQKLNNNISTEQNKENFYNFLVLELDNIKKDIKNLEIYNDYSNISSIINEVSKDKDYKNYIKLKDELNQLNTKLITNNNYINYNIEVQIRNITQFLYNGNITDIDFEKKTFKIKLISTTSSIVQNFFRKFPIKFANLCITDKGYNSQNSNCKFDSIENPEITKMSESKMTTSETETEEYN